MRILLPLVLLLGCAVDSVTPGDAMLSELGETCDNVIPCAHDPQDDQAAIQCTMPTGEVCAKGPSECEGVCMDQFDPETPCPPGTDRCFGGQVDAYCVDLQTAFNDCGACNNTCVDDLDAGVFMACVDGACCVQGEAGCPGL